MNTKRKIISSFSLIEMNNSHQKLSCKQYATAENRTKFLTAQRKLYSTQGGLSTA
jgi:hypothetical protein